MKPTIFLSLITLPFTLAGTINKAKASSPDLIASIAEFRSIFDPESSVILPRQDKGRKCEDLEGWKRCVSSCLELCDMICDCSGCPSNCVDRCAEIDKYRGCNGDDLR